MSAAINAESTSADNPMSCSPLVYVWCTVHSAPSQQGGLSCPVRSRRPLRRAEPTRAERNRTGAELDAAQSLDDVPGTSSGLRNQYLRRIAGESCRYSAPLCSSGARRGRQIAYRDLRTPGQREFHAQKAHRRIEQPSGQEPWRRTLVVQTYRSASTGVVLPVFQIEGSAETAEVRLPDLVTICCETLATPATIQAELFRPALSAPATRSSVRHQMGINTKFCYGPALHRVATSLN